MPNLKKGTFVRVVKAVDRWTWPRDYMHMTGCIAGVDTKFGSPRDPWYIVQFPDGKDGFWREELEVVTKPIYRSGRRP